MNATLAQSIKVAESPQAIAIRETNADRCAVCGKVKLVGEPFCWRDMKKLSSQLRAALKFASGSEYVVLYEEAKAVLAEGRKS
jgi:hypothetical protein